ncbi:Na+/H+ antiporter NhaA [Helicobacter enhydrae]|uniref:Na(+)/H(+) antiporter NhaA n=1 Tax=Helicobacter enhydrae TaxID=222136 RepID=A0A1B1U4V7_9HELI|nr:Na+/H+ antiporter NhaA [Helicobacter enhydrae]ANV97771.1 Na+/H+ antiporter NhaA [Helicobacter enhydrae]
MEKMKKIVMSESFGGVFLFCCAVLAMIVANSGLSEWYFHLWHEQVGLSIAGKFYGFDLHLWVNDVLMSLFFLMVGLEIKREFLFGGLSGFKKAAFPAIAAIGGMIVPAGIYLAFNMGTETSHGFGIPMATDIAFALGVVLMLGKRVPPALKLFLVTLAVVDDLGAIVVIAIFYSSGIAWEWLGVSAFLTGVLFAFNYGGVRNLIPYLCVGVALWFCIHESGIHATISAVILAFTIPAKPKIFTQDFLRDVQKDLLDFNKAEEERKDILLTNGHFDAVHQITKRLSYVQNPLLKLEHSLHSLSTYLIMPLFAFANAGVSLSGGVDFASMHLMLGVILGLLIGKPLGILLLTFLCEKLGIATRPTGIAWSHILGAGILAGIGFTMSIFVANLAFTQASFVEIAKISILSASLLAGILGSLFLLVLGRKSNVVEF